MSKFNELPDNFEDLIRTHSWEELPFEEKIILEKEGINKAEYESIRSILNRMDTFEIEPVQADPTIKNNLMAAFDQPAPKVIPLYRKYLAIAASLALIVALSGVFYVYMPKNESTVVQELEKVNIESPALNDYESYRPEETEKIQGAAEVNEVISSDNLNKSVKSVQAETSNDEMLMSKDEDNSVLDAESVVADNQYLSKSLKEETKQEVVIQSNVSKPTTPLQMPAEAEFSIRSGNMAPTYSDNLSVITAQSKQEKVKKEGSKNKSISQKSLLAYTVTIY